MRLKIGEFLVEKSYRKVGNQVTVIVFSLIRNGSVIASFNVSYSSIDSLQIVILQEEMASGMLGNWSAELLEVSSNYGKSNKTVCTIS